MKHNNIYIFLIAIFLFLVISLIMIGLLKIIIIYFVDPKTEQKTETTIESIINEPKKEIDTQKDPLITPASSLK